MLLFSVLIGLAHATTLPKQSTTKVATYGQTRHGYDSQVRGWNSFGIDANNVVPGWELDQAHVQQQCDRLASSPLKDSGFVYCSIDSGWSEPYDGDENGRIIPNATAFDVPGLAKHLHDQGLRLGLYVVPGAFQNDVNKTILGTNVKIGDVCTGDEGLARCVFDYSQEATQTWHDSVVAQFADW